MLKYSPVVLAVIVLLGVIVALIPRGTTEASSGVVLRGVSLKLYPAADQQAEWRFEADTITADPESGETTIDRLRRGERFVSGKLDTEVRTDRLTIDASDNLRSTSARLYIPAQCLTVSISGTDAQPVVIDQQTGFSGPRARIQYPDAIFTAGPVQASFDLKQVNFQNTSLQANLDSTEQCVNGKLVPRRTNQ
ncbi:hypothetical protein [Deinococcus pimensis]|uniref:hypothetical protein n=1 Tax=Deinococcus pimensis TaxID=309888 RepID=UPI000483693D|nr:hypothetical protein [Deinococcus pimensis]